MNLVLEPDPAAHKEKLLTTVELPIKMPFPWAKTTHWFNREIFHSSGGRNRWRGGRSLRHRHHVGPRTVVTRGGALPSFRIGNAGVEHVHQGKAEALGDRLQLAQGQVALVELVIGQALVDQVS